MRATTIRTPSPAARAAGVLTAALMAMSVMAAPAVAATPNWTMDPVVLLPSTVTPGDVAGYRVTIHNAGPSSISQLYVTGYLGGTDDPAPLPVFTSTTRGSCPNTDGTLFCTLGSLKKNQSVTVVAAFTTPTAGESFSIRFEANTTGATSSDGGTSHGDTIDQTGTTALSDDPDFAGRFVTTGLQLVANNQALSVSNQQTTQVSAPALNIGVTVADGTPASDWCPTCQSQSSELHVNNGAPYSGGFRIDIQAYKDLVNGSIDVVYHQRDDNTVEEITNACPRNGNPNQNQMPCFKTQNLGGGNTLVIIWTQVNGKYGF